MLFNQTTKFKKVTIYTVLLGSVDLSSLILQRFVGDLYKAELLSCGCFT